MNMQKKNYKKSHKLKKNYMLGESSRMEEKIK